jgi:hypothetical protein
MFGLGAKHIVPAHIASSLSRMWDYKNCVTQARVRLMDGREFGVRIMDWRRIVAIQGYTYLPFSASEIVSAYQAEGDRRFQGGHEWVYLVGFFDFWAFHRYRVRMENAVSRIVAWFKG